MLLVTVGRAVIWSLEMLVAAPVFSTESLDAAVETTIASLSISLSIARSAERLYDSASWRVMSV